MRTLDLGVLLRDGGPRPAASERSLPPAGREQALVELAVAAETLGLDALWIDASAGAGVGHAAAPLVLAAIAARTRRLRLGAVAAVAPGADPLRVAEDWATLDAVSNGRIELATAAAAEVTGEVGARMREQLELLLRLWRDPEVTWSGRFRAPLTRVRVEPRPIQTPHPPVWVAGATPAAADLAAGLGLPLLLHGAALGPGMLRTLLARYRDRFSGPAAGRRVGLCEPLQTLRSEAPHPPEDRSREPLDSKGFSDSKRSEPEPDQRPASASVAAIPAERAERIAAACESLELDLCLGALDAGGLAPAAAAQALAVFAREVAPRLRGA